MSLTKTKIPDSLLKKLQCSKCGHYLSMAPIEVRSDGSSVCNRCISSQLLPVSRCALFEELASLHLFPCSYRAQGCTEYIEFNKAHEHESWCPFRAHACPVSLHSSCSWKGTAIQFSRHYKRQHPELYVKSASFQIPLTGNYQLGYLTEVDRVVLLLQVKVEQEKLWLNTVYIGNDMGNLQHIKYEIELNNEDKGRTFKLNNQSPSAITCLDSTINAAAVNMSALMIILQHPEVLHCCWHISVAEELKNQLEMQQHSEDALKAEAPRCSICSAAMVPPINRCPLAHVVCVDCKGYNDCCGICQKINIEFTRAIDLEDIAQSSQYHCRWSECTKLLGCNEIRVHEQECRYRQYKCPECSMCTGVFEVVHSHFKVAHSDIPFEVSKSDSLSFSMKTLFRYVLVYGEIFKVSVLRDVSNTWTVYITYFGPPGLDSRWKYEVRDRYNALYYASKCCDNRYKVTQRTYCTNNVRSEYFLTVKFIRQKTADIWIPLDCPPKRLRKSARNNTLCF